MSDAPNRKIKKCENHCPKCGSDDIEWESSQSISDATYEQRSFCNQCQLCFAEISKLVYQYTIIDGDNG